MKILITFKSPDALDYAIEDIVTNTLDKAASTKIANNIRRVAHKFIEYDEYVTIELDLDAETAKVVPVKELK